MNRPESRLHDGSLYRQARRAEETERADAQHHERALTYWHEDDDTVVVHGRFPSEMGARILSALDAAMDAHAQEQPVAAWEHEYVPPDVPRGPSGAGARANAVDIAGVPPSPDAPRGTRPRGASRTVRVVHGLVHTARRARAGRKDSSTTPQDPTRPARRPSQRCFVALRSPPRTVRGAHRAPTRWSWGTSSVPIQPDNSRATTPDRLFAPDTMKSVA